MSEKKWDMSDSYVFNFHQGRQDAYYLATVVYNDNKQNLRIESNIKGYWLIITNIPHFNKLTNEIGEADTLYSDIRLLVESNRRSEKNYNLALKMMEEGARESIMLMEEDKEFIENLAKENDVDVNEMRKRIEELHKAIKEVKEETEEEFELGSCKPPINLVEVKEKKNKKKVKKEKKVTFDDVAGMEEAKEALLDVIDQIKKPEKYEYFDIPPIKSVLLYGASGTGKTYIANAFANMIDANFVKVNMGDIASKYQGQTGNNIKRIFDEARKSEQFTVLFWDEVDAVANRRGMDENSKEKNATMNVLLTEMSSEDNSNIFMIFATNFYDLLDPAFLRSGRCDVKIEIPLPNLETRLQILQLNTRKKPLGEDVNLKDVAEKMEGKNCADVSLICNQSARCALKKDKMEINQEDFIETLEKMNMKKNEEEKIKKIGFSL